MQIRKSDLTEEIETTNRARNTGFRHIVAMFTPAPGDPKIFTQCADVGKKHYI